MSNDLKKLIIVASSVVGGLILIILIVYFITAGGNKKVTYERFEEIIVEKAKVYFDSHPNDLPTLGKEKLLYYNTMVNLGIAKPIEKVLDNPEGCVAYASIKNINNKYIYTPYLNCQDRYQSLELYKKIISDNKIVTTDKGLYKRTDGYFFRGDVNNNFVLLNEELYKIIKINKDNTVTLIKTVKTEDSYVWDDRHNSYDEDHSSSGINDFEVSKIKDLLLEMETNSEIIPDTLRGKLVSKKICIGKRALNDKTNDNSIECSVMSKDEYLISLITVSDYMYASLDKHCTTVNDRACMNYNFLSTLSSSHTLTAVKDNTYKIYYFDSYGLYPTDASNMRGIHLVINLAKDVMYRSGVGTKEEPYLIK